MPGRTAAATVTIALIAMAIPLGSSRADTNHGRSPSRPEPARVVASCPNPGGAKLGRAAPPNNDRPVVLYGVGLGHSVGMSQYGARGAASSGCSAGRILGTYYPGTRRVTRDLKRLVQVWMLRQGHRATLALEQHPDRNVKVVWRHRGNVVARQPEGRTWTVKRIGVRTRLFDARGRIRFDRRTTGRYPLRAWHGNRVVNLRTYRDGRLVTHRRLKYQAAKFNVVGARLNVKQNFFSNGKATGMDKYLWGLAEVPAAWPRASLRAQAIAARTFAVRADRTLWPTTADQFYGGHDPFRDEPTSRWRQAVDRSSGRIIVDSSGRPIEALYTASHGGWSEDARYVWGGGGQPYLRAVKDTTWTRASGDPAPRWSRSFTYRRFANEFGFDRVTGVRIARRGTERRLRGVRIEGRVSGTSVTKFVSGARASRALDLPSPGFIIVTR